MRDSSKLVYRSCRRFFGHCRYICNNVGDRVSWQYVSTQIIVTRQYLYKQTCLCIAVVISWEETLCVTSQHIILSLTWNTLNLLVHPNVGLLSTSFVIDVESCHGRPRFRGVSPNQVPLSCHLQAVVEQIGLVSTELSSQPERKSSKVRL